MGFSATFSHHFDHPPPFEIPAEASDQDHLVTTDPGSTSEDLFGVLGAANLFKRPPGDFLCAAIRTSGEASVAFFLMIVEGERYFYFRDQVRDLFNASASPEACFKALDRVLKVFKSRPEQSFKMSYNLGQLMVNNKVLG